jgi:hypothetical protein
MALPLPDDYLTESLDVANRRVSLAGHRLIDRLNVIYPKKQAKDA